MEYLADLQNTVDPWSFWQDLLFLSYQNRVLRDQASQRLCLIAIIKLGVLMSNLVMHYWLLVGLTLYTTQSQAYANSSHPCCQGTPSLDKDLTRSRLGKLATTH